MASSLVRVLNVTHVRPDEANSPTPPAHGDHRTINLSFLDSFHVASGAIQRLFFYEGPGLPPFPSIVRSLQSSLAATLPVFLPLAGKLTFRAATRDVVIDCSPSAVSSGVKFVEAEFSGGADGMHRLASDDEHDTEAFRQLVPDLEGRELPAPVLAVQVTRSAGCGAGAGGAVAVGVSIHHAVADGQSLWQFMRWWSASSRDAAALLTAPGLVLPTFDRTAIRHPKADELAATFSRLLAPDLPLVRSSSSSSPPPEQRRRTFLLGADQVEALKQCISMQSKISNGQASKPPSTYVALSALVWTSIVRAKSMDHADDVFFMLTADCRRRLRPPVDECFFGNCVTGCFATATAGDLCAGADGLARATSAIESAIREQLEDPESPLTDILRWLRFLLDLPPGRLAAVGSSHRFMAYETDFGWGAPRRAELVSVFGREMVTLLGARGGCVQVSAALDRACMDAFAANFLLVAGAARQQGSSAA